MDRSLKKTLQSLREDWATHGRSWRHRGMWGLALFRYGQWVLQLRNGPIKSVLNGVYAAATVFSPIITGVALDRNTQVGRCPHLIHPAMILIHPAAVIGDRVGIMHGVTLGTQPNTAGAPTIGNDVFLGAYATILGPIKIGDGAKIAANSLIVCDVPAGATAIGVPAKVYPAAGFQIPQRRTTTPSGAANVAA